LEAAIKKWAISFWRNMKLIAFLESLNVQISIYASVIQLKKNKKIIWKGVWVRLKFAQDVMKTLKLELRCNFIKNINARSLKKIGLNAPFALKNSQKNSFLLMFKTVKYTQSFYKRILV